MQKFPALSWSDQPSGITTGSVHKPRKRPPPPRIAQPNPRYQRSAEYADEQYYDPPTYEPLPRYSKPDRDRNRYQWNGNHNRRVIDNRPKQQRLARRAPVIVDAHGRRAVRVEPGDTMYGIARRHGVTVRELMHTNGMHRPEIRVGQFLTLPSFAR